MPLIVEDGGIIAGANSYVSLADSDTFFDQMGLAKPTEGQLHQAMITLNNLCYLGTQTDSTLQELPWPRSGVCDKEGNEYSNGIIPQALKQAQMWLAYYIAQGNDPSAVPTSASGTGSIKKEKVDVIEVEYYEATTGGTAKLTLNDLPNFWQSIKHLLKDGGGFGGSGAFIGRTIHA